MRLYAGTTQQFITDTYLSIFKDILQQWGFFVINHHLPHNWFFNNIWELNKWVNG